MRTKHLVPVLVLVSAFVGGGAAAQDQWACSPWESVTPEPYPLRLNTVAPAQGTLWAFGETGAAVSRDGRSWQRVSQLSGKLDAVIWTGAEFLGAAGNRILSSPDGVTWSPRHELWEDPIFFTNHLRSIAWNGQTFVAVGEDYSDRYSMGSPILIASRNGVTWFKPERPPVGDPSHSFLRQVVWTGDRFAAVGSFLLTSPDGENWTANEEIEGEAIASGGGTTVVASGDVFRVSQDLANWQVVVAPVIDATLHWVEGRFFAAGFCRGCPDRESSLFWSHDGMTWQRAAFDVPVRVRGITVHGEDLAAVGDGVAWSTGGENWRSGHAQLAGTLTAFAAGENGMVAVGSGGELLRSANGRAWRRVFWGGADPLWGLASRGDEFLAVGDNVVLTSDDGESWAAAPAPGGARLEKVVANNRGFVAVSADRRVFFSMDGIDWQVVDLLPLVSFRFFVDLEAGPDTFVVSVWNSDSGGTILASEDGLNWQVGAVTRSSLPNLAWGGGRFLAVDFGTVLSSTDGRVWEAAVVGLELANLTWIGSRFAGWEQWADRFFTSVDGILWQPADGPPWPSGRVAGAPGVLWQVGGNGAISRSTCGEVGSQMHIPSMAHLSGAQGTVWRSDLILHNPGAEPITVGVAATVRGESAPGGWAAFTLEAGETRWLEDVLAADLAMEGAATVRVASWGGAVYAVGRTFNQTPSGSFGQFVSPFPPGSAIPPGGQSRLIGLSHAAERTRGFRTNIGLVNPTVDAVSVDVELFAGDGMLLGVMRPALGAGQSLQLNDVFRSVTSGEVADGFAVVRPASAGGPVHAYASVVDNLSGDAVFIVPAVILPGGIPGWIPGAGHVRGLNQSVWRTDLQLHNPESRDTDCRIDLFPWGAPGPAPAGVTVRVPSGSSLRLPDVVGALFAWEGGASLRITPLDGPLMLNARTWTATGAGTVGQGVPAFTSDQEVVAGRPGRLIALRQHPSKTAGFRSNLGLVNTADAAAMVHIDLLHSSGQTMSSLTHNLRPWESVQLTEVLRAAGGLGSGDAAAVVRVTTPGARVLAYGCLIDNRTNDPILVPAATP